MQLTSAYYSANVAYPSGSVPSATANFIQGICPIGWHVPSGGTTIIASEFLKLHNSVGGGVTDTSNTGVPYATFWKPTSASFITITDPWKSIYTGVAFSSGSEFVGEEVRFGVWWSSTEYDAENVRTLNVSTNNVNPQSNTVKQYGLPVRCIKD